MPLTLPHGLGFGLAAVARPGYITLGRDEDLGEDRGVEALRTRTHDLLDAAYAQGVRYIDAARSYGRAEEFLADWLAARPDADDVVVGSKWGYTYTANWAVHAERHEVKDHGLATYERQRAETDALLGDRLGLYQIHSVTPGSPALTDRKLHARLAEAAAGGLTVGFSTSGPAQADAIRAALAVTVDGEPLFRTVQSTYNALETSAGPALAEAHDAGLTVIVKEGMANGRLAGPHAPAALRTVAEETGLTCDAVALALILRQPWADVVLSGAATRAQLASNLSAATARLDDDQVAALAALAEEPRAYWERRGRLPWH
ncbi:aldo/keto reductase [Streptomyces fumanus]|uniref:Oxidoreductase n=1 Tax=Streptomyces fumanus TaxID=67302 RepID=A0A919AP85_9ACTN|nr:aldo/keto reductase [Streptomyces fumanus]GHF16536.1 oxidoreductase [Streptomyces fumanus]